MGLKWVVKVGITDFGEGKAVTVAKTCGKVGSFVYYTWNICVWTVVLSICGCCR